jgi:hypothetical protein
MLIVATGNTVLSVPGIEGYERVPARVDCFYQNKIFFHDTNGQLKQEKQVLIRQPTLTLFSVFKAY